MKELTDIKIKDNLTGTIYRLIGFDVGGDDRAGLFVNKIVLYDEHDRLRVTVTNPKEMKRLSLIRE